MALINCPECGKEISNKSKACIHCGYELVHNKSTTTSKSAIALNIAAFVFTIVATVFLNVNQQLLLSILIRYIGLCLLTCIIGIIIPNIKKSATKKLISFIYVVLAALNICVCVFSIFINVGIAFVINLATFIPSVLQLVAGTKFLSKNK